jgi:hypothetical protein
VQATRDEAGRCEPTRLSLASRRPRWSALLGFYCQAASKPVRAPRSGGCSRSDLVAGLGRRH